MLADDKLLLEQRLYELDDILQRLDKSLDKVTEDTSDVARSALLHSQRMHSEERLRLLKMQESDNTPTLDDALAYTAENIEMFKRDVARLERWSSEHDIERISHYKELTALLQSGLEGDTASLLQLISMTQKHIDNAKEQVRLENPERHILLFTQRKAYFMKLLEHARELSAAVLPDIACDKVPSQEDSVTQVENA